MDPAAVPPRAPQVLQVLPCLNEAGLKPWDCGLWDETTMPSTLTGIISPERHLQAIQHINKIHHKKYWFGIESEQAVLTVFMVMGTIVGTVMGIIMLIETKDLVERIGIIVAFLVLYGATFKYRKQVFDRIMYLLKKAVGGANTLLCDDNILIGCRTNAELVFVYVPLDACRERPRCRVQHRGAETLLCLRLESLSRKDAVQVAL
ncbi:uncharacterized protein LOC129409796 [Boleophthalmus pectinirostris]|uniref:uncharacterized protein LOC129409796 n=1 Tax=Boleophthalmus pectinirostris TaxID=150288 RepID=UPI002432D385|nr:uncharacterized protein LOC129409796 [Boleophthalmus pectinirostris]XP_055012520.1 uncharacterized protein LOC129409796 [Boleophthalmus pectinirostris]